MSKVVIDLVMIVASCRAALAIIGIMVSVVFSVEGCVSGKDVDTEGFVVEVEDEAVVGSSWDTYRDRAKRNTDGSFIAEGDLYFPDEESLRQHYESLRLEEPSSKLAVFQQTSTGYEPVFTGSDALDIVYCVSTTVPSHSTVVADMATATTDWSNNANVRFRYDSSKDASCNSATSGIDIAVVPTTIPGLAGCGFSRLLWSELSGACSSGPGTLQVQYSVLSSFPGITGAGLLRHEIGHIIGFRHEHPWADDEGGCAEDPTMAMYDLTGRRLTDYDQSSVMHYPQCDGVPNVDWSISQLDQRGAISIYGIPAAWYSAIL
jgi:hypothetical protein